VGGTPAAGSRLRRILEPGRLLFARLSSILGIVLIAAALLSVAAVVVQDLRRTDSEAGQMYAGSVQGLAIIGDLQYQAQEARRSLLNALTTTDRNLQVAYLERSLEATRRVGELMDAHMKLQRSEAGTSLAERFRTSWAAYVAVRDEVTIGIRRGNDREALDRDLRQGAPAFQRAHDDLLEMKNHYTWLAERRLAEIVDSSRRTMRRLILMLALSLVLVAIAARHVHTTRMMRAQEHSAAALRESEAKFRTLADTAASAIFIAEQDRIRYVNPWAERVTGYPAEELLRKGLFDVVHPLDRERIRDRVLASVERLGPSRHEFRIVTRGGEERWLDFTAASTIFEGRPALLGTAFDVTDRKRAEDRIEYQAYHDALTDLPNRMLFLDRLQVALAHARRHGGTVAVMFLDLDQFKLINDTLGHGAGDRLLKGVADRLRACVREVDTVGRLGGDEFTLLLPEVGRGEDAAKIAEKILDAVGRPFQLDGRELFVTTSIGIGVHPSDGDDPETLLKSADSAMYRAKELGRNNYQLFTAAMNERAMSRLSLENGLRHALEREEFVVHYQPQVSIDSGRLVGMEALVRWNHAEKGLVAPGEFIPLAEDSRLIIPLGQWILAAACRQAVRWHEAGLTHLRVAVNLSVRQLQHPDLIRDVEGALSAAGLSPGRLELEVTESAAMQNVELTLSALLALREMGVRISMDDFGTGHSSLSHLKQFPVDAVKIDKSFVQDMTIDPYDAVIVSSVIGMAHSLRLKVVAEGVETAEQFQFLRQRGCDEAQGYLFSEPRPADALDGILRTLTAP